MNTILTTPVNLLDTLDPDSSRVYVRKVLARSLGHAMSGGMSRADAFAVWTEAGFTAEQWNLMLPVTEQAAGWLRDQ